MDVFDGLLFDLDGTLWDSVDAICISWNRALERLAPEYAGTVTRARLLPCMGMLLPDILHRLVPELDQERMKPILEEVLSEENAYVAAHGGVLYPGVEQTLAALSARCPLFLVSNCQDGYIEAFFQAHGLGRYFTDYENPGHTGLPKADKMEFIVQKAVELGVSRIVPYLSKNCVSRPDKTEKKVERWRKIAAEAAKQCGRGRLPEVAAVVPVAQAIAQAAESETALFFYENEKRTGLRDALAGGVRDTVSLMVGPEGGFDPAEARAAVDAGLHSVSLGTRILRCETAPIAALAAVLYAGGNM